MKAKKILCAFLSMVMVLSACIGATLSSVSADDLPQYVVSTPEDDKSNLSITKKIEVKPDGTYLTLEAYAKGLMDVSEYYVPMDIALVLDVSGSMDETIKAADGTDTSNLVPELAEYYYYNRGWGNREVRYQNGKWQFYYRGILSSRWIDISDYSDGSVYINKMDALIGCAKMFLDALAENAAKYDLTHRVSIISYSSNVSQKTGLLNVSNATNMTSLKRALESLVADGATRIDSGIKTASNLLLGNSARSDAGKAIIVFTDGEPTSSSGFETTVANNALSEGMKFKDAGGSIFSIGALTNPSSQAKKFLEYLSSNYPKANSMSSTTAKTSDGYYLMIGVEGAIKDVMQKLSFSVVSTNMQADSISVLKDQLSDFYKFVGNGKGGVDSVVKVIPCTGEDTWGTAKDATGVTVSFEDKVVSVSGFNYVDLDNIVHYDEVEKVWKGNKLSVTFKIEPDEDAEWIGGTHNYPTNEKASIGKNGKEIIILEESPTVSVVRYVVTFNKGAHGTLGEDEEATISDNYAEGAEYPVAPTANPDEYFVFDYWEDDSDHTKVTSFPENVTEDASYTAVYKQVSAEYTVNHFKMDVNGNYPVSPDATETKTGEIGKNAAYTAKYSTPYSVDGVKTIAKTVLADGSTVVNVYYKLPQYTVTFYQGENGTLSPNPTTGTYYHGAAFPAAPAPTPDTNYSFSHWVDGSGTPVAAGGFPTTVTGAATYTAVYTQTGGNVSIKYYVMDTDGEYPDTPTFTDSSNETIGETVTAEGLGLSVTEFSIDNDKSTMSGTVTSDGLELVVYYIRAQHTITFKEGDHGTLKDATGADADVVSGQYRYEHAFPSVPASEADEHYAFAYWTDEKTGDKYGTGYNAFPTTVTEDRTFVAVYTQVSASYKVEHYFQQTDGTTYTINNELTDTLSAALNTEVTPAAKTVAHYSVNAEMTSEKQTVKADGSLVLKVYYDLDTITVTFYSGDHGFIHGETSGKFEITGLYGSDLTWVSVTDDMDIDQYFAFDCWKDATGAKVENIPTTFTENASYTATFKQVAAPYKVIHYVMDTEEQYSEVTADTEYLDSELGKKVTATPKDYGDQYSVNNTLSKLEGDILADGSLVLEVYYDLAQVTVTFKKGDHGTIKDDDDGVVESTLRYGAEFPTVPTIVADAHYAFDYWADSTGAKVDTLPTTATATETYTAVYKQVNADYVVKHYKQATDGKYYLVEDDTENLNANVGATVTATPKDYGTHYTVNNTKSILSDVISTEKTTTLEVYYDLEQVLIVFDDGEHGSFLVVNGNTLKKSVFYGAAFPAVPELEADEHFEFDYWEDSNGQKVTSFPETALESETYTAVYKQVSADPGIIEPKAAAYKVLIYKEKTEGGYELIDTKILVGEIGKDVTFTPILVEHCVYNSTLSVNTGKVVMPTAGESEPVLLTLTLYYDLTKGTISFNAGEHGSFDGEDTKELPGKYGQNFPEIPTPDADEHFEFDHWEDENGEIVTEFPETITGDVVYTAVYKQVSADPGIIEPKAAAYLVEIYKEKEDGTFELVETKIFVDEIGKDVSYTPEIPDGYVLDKKQSVLSGKVVLPEGDEPNVLTFKAYLSIEVDTIIFDAGDNGTFGGKDKITADGKNGSAFPNIPDPTPDEGFEFIGWKDETGKMIKSFPEIIEGNHTYTAVYAPITGDSSAPAVWFMASIFAVVGACLTLFAKKRRENY